MVQNLSKIQNSGLLLLLFLLPLFFLPLTPDFFDFNKMVLLVLGTLVLAIIWALRQAQGKLTFITTPLDLPVFAVAAIFLLSTFLRTLNKADAFLFPGTATIILALTLLYFLITQTLHKNLNVLRTTLYALLTSALFVSLVAITASLGILENIPQLPGYLKSRTFSLIGAPLPTITFLLVMLPLAIAQVIKARRDKLLTTYHLLLSILLVLAITSIVFQISPGRPTSPRILPISVGWSIAVETLKVSPLGVGPGNFVSAFNLSRPLSYNQTDLWNTRFAVSSNWYLQLFTEVGILGLLVFLFLVWRIVTLVRSIKEENSDLRFVNYSLILILLLFLFIPANLLLIFAFYVLLGLLAAQFSREKTLGGVQPAFVVLLLVLTVASTALFFGSRAYGAELDYKKALEAAARNDAKPLYDFLLRAINKNPYVDRYRISLSQADLAIANAIARKEDLTDQDRQTINQLVQQAIREARSAVALNNRLSTNWENLARVYRALIPFAAGADQWAVATYSQAIAFEPINPFFRINLGGVHYGAGRYDEAIKAFELAVLLKSDFANAHYNLSAALREKGDLGRAIGEMEQTLALVSPGTKDYETAQKELENLKTLRQAQGKAGGEGTVSVGETLEAPQPAPKPVLVPPLELPEEAGPPVPGGD